MKKIRERALAYMCNNIERTTRKAMYEAYVDGAEDQKQIDVDKACEYLLNNISERLVLCRNKSWKPLDKFVKDFKKAMEDK